MTTTDEQRPEPDDTAPDLPAFAEHDPAFERLLQHVKDVRHFDFTGYKRASLTRRVRRRMSVVDVDSYDEYLDRLEVDPGEFAALFNTILINVTGFFRDRDLWQYLAEEVVPDLLRVRPTGALRFWSAGCAGGQEPYSLAMVLHDALGADEFRDRVKIYATDVDAEALAEARLASYPAAAVESLPDDLERHFDRDVGAGRVTVRKDVRRAVIFGRNDLVQDAPISRIDLLLCRNTLMYFNAEQQNGILRRLHFALNPGGRLALGKAEMVLGSDTLFEPVDLKRRVFRRAGALSPRDSGNAVRQGPVPRPAEGALGELRAATLASAPVALVIVAGGRLVLANERAESLLGVGSRDVGRPFQDLEMSYRPVELRSAIEHAERERLPVWVRDVRLERPNRETAILDVQLLPVAGMSTRADGVALYFNDVTRHHAMRTELERANRQVETAYEELQSTNEELETTNEELQSTVEELETTNEELQSTNEELETMNEELQSMNDEFQRSNDALRGRTAEIEELNELLEAILTNLRGGVMVVDSDLKVLLWNKQAEELWGVRSDEAIGRHLFGLDIGLPLDSLRPLARRMLRPVPPGRGLSTGELLTVSAHNRRGRPITVRVTGNPLRAGDGSVRGAVLVTEDITDVDGPEHGTDDGSSVAEGPTDD